MNIANIFSTVNHWLLLKRRQISFAHSIRKIDQEFKSNMPTPPNDGVQRVLGVWIYWLLLHSKAILRLASKQDLGMSAEVHYRQLVEIFLQFRKIALAKPALREEMARKIMIFGILDWMQKLENLQDLNEVASGFTEMKRMLAKFPEVEVANARRARKEKKWNWYETSFTQLARDVSQEGERFGNLYQLTSGSAHGSWNVALGVSESSQGDFVYSPVKDRKTMYRWAEETMSRAENFLIDTWREISQFVGFGEDTST